MTAGRPGGPAARLLLEALLRAYPRTFRDRYGHEVRDAFWEERAQPRYAGIRGGARFWIDMTMDTVHAASRLRRPGGRVRSAVRSVRPVRRERMQQLLHDLRFAVRLARRSPLASLVIVLSLALGIGGTTLVVSVADALVFRPFRLPDADRLVVVGATFPKSDMGERFVETLSPAEAAEIRAARTLRDVMAFDLGNRNLTGDDAVPERVFTALVWGDPFRTMGLPPLLGRGFTPEDWREGAAPVAIVSHRIWQSRFGADRALVGRIVKIHGQPTTVVGVMPPGAVLVGTDLWLPLAADPDRWPRNARQFTVVGRLAPDATVEDANAELGLIAARAADAHAGRFPDYDGWRLRAASWAEAFAGEWRPAAWLLLAAVGFVLLIACANLANLQLARASARQPELAVRFTLGAGMRRVVRQLLTETGVLAVAGGGLGVWLASIGARSSPSWLPRDVRLLDPVVTINGRVLACAAALTLGAALAVGVAPAFHAARAAARDSLARAARASASRRAQRVRHLLVGAQVALVLLLLAGAGLLGRSFLAVQHVDPGFRPDRLISMRLTLPPDRYRGDAIVAFFNHLVERVAASPGVQQAAVASQLPPDGFFRERVTIDGALGEREGSLPTALVTIASRELPSALGTTLRSGRRFAPADGPGTPPVALVNEAFARRYLGAAPIGARVRVGEGEAASRPFEVVGVLADTRNRGPLEAPDPEVFVLLDQVGGLWNQLFLLVRAEGDPAAVVPGVRRAVAALDPEQPVYALSTMREALARATAQQRTALSVMALFATLALALAALGIYGLVSFAVEARVREIGIRMALGARAAEVRRLVFAQTGRVLLGGIVAGLVGSAALSRGIRALLHGVDEHDPLTLLAATLVLAGVGLAASVLPARRATRIEPVRALRHE
jgi:predicted permease